MASALASLVNATVTLTVPGSGTVVDTTTGNVVPAEDEVVYQLFLRSGAPVVTELPGINTETMVLEGYCVDPQLLDARVVEGTFGVVDFAEQGEYECKVLQVRHSYGSVGLLGSTLAGALGDKIRLARLRRL